MMKLHFPALRIVLATLTALTHLSAEEIKLWPQGAPGSEGKDSPEVVETSPSGERKITNVNFPSITPFLPPADKATGASVIVAPGGGHKNLCMTHEGDNVAQWLADHGIAAFVLKYRLASEAGSTYTVDGHAVADMQRALRLVRSRAAEWHLNAAAVGVMGFSAGGEVCFMASQLATTGAPESADPLEKLSSRPDFQALIYPGRSVRIAPTKENPPTFLAASANDREDISEGLANVYLLYKKAHVPVELHLYAGGSHGFGLRPGKTAPIDAWVARFEEWLTERGLNTVQK
jgi:acetyl esterase/lipase